MPHGCHQGRRHAPRSTDHPPYHDEFELLPDNQRQILVGALRGSSVTTNAVRLGAAKRRDVRTLLFAIIGGLGVMT